MTEDEIYISDVELTRSFREALNKYEGVMQIETNPRDLKRAGKVVITMYGVPKEDV